MPATTVTCPSCNTTLKPKTPLPAGARVKCPKCQTAFVVPGDALAPAAAPAPAPAAPKPKPTPPPAEEAVGVAEAADESAADDGAAAARPKKKIPLWVWLASGGGVLFLLCGCCGVGSLVMYLNFMGGGAVSPGNYTSLKKGMSEAEVKKILGEPALATPDVNGSHTDTWKSGTDFITVLFQKDKAVGRSCDIQNNGALKLNDSGLLPW